MIGEEWNTSGGLGPQIRFLDALFVRAAALTPEDVEAFADAWYLGEWPRHRIDDWRGAWNRTTTAISEAGRDGGWLMIRDQFGEVDTKDVWGDDESLPWEVAMSAARDAAVGVLSRDRVEPRDYDELTMGWRCLIGPVHPDDEDPGSSRREIVSQAADIRRTSGFGRDEAAVLAAQSCVDLAARPRPIS